MVTENTDPSGRGIVCTKDGVDEPEEGEIVDEFEDISSDEEISMKKRIEELEEINLELEKIEKISVVYHYDLGYIKNRYSHETLTVSDVSDNDDLYLSPGQYSHHRHSNHLGSKVVKEKTHSRENVRKRTRQLAEDNELEQLYSKTRKKKCRRISKNRSKKKPSKIRKKEFYETQSSSEEEFCALNRDKLRLALKRDVKVLRSTPVRNSSFKKYSNGCQAINLDVPPVEQEFIVLSDDVEEEKIAKGERKSDTDDSQLLEEQELRLIALKSAIMKKHFKRKKRKESEDKKPYSPSEFLEIKGNYGNSPQDSIESGPMDISPISSPDYIDNDDGNKAIDMDLVSSNSSSPVLIGHEGNWVPIDEIPLPEKTVKVILSPTPIRRSPSLPAKLAAELQKSNCREQVVEIIKSSSPEPSDEEELALRTLLLAKMKCPKVDKKFEDLPVMESSEHDLDTQLPIHSVLVQAEEQMNNNFDVDTSLDTEALRAMMFLNVEQKPLNKTELVLKEAVRRLKYQNHSDDKTDVDPMQMNDEYPCNESQVEARHDQFKPVNLNEEWNENRQQFASLNIPIETASTLIYSNLTDAPMHTVSPNIFPRGMEAPDNSHGFENYKLESSFAKTQTNHASVKNQNISNRSALVPVKIQNFESNEKVENSTEFRSETSLKQLEPILPQIASVNSQPIIRSALKPVSLVSPSNAESYVQAVNIPKMKTKVVRTRTKVVNKIPLHIAQQKRKLLSDSAGLEAAKRKKLEALKGVQNFQNTSSRLITNMEAPIVQKVVIQLGNSDSDSDEFTNDISFCNLPVDTQQNYFDNASPMSLPMDSPCYSPLPQLPAQSVALDETPSKVEPIHKTSTKKIIENDIFQARLDEFLKNARKKVEQVKKESTTKNTSTPRKSTSTTTTPSTPLAVRHLPPSSQLEYRRLINRMKILEKQKQAKSMKTTTNLGNAHVILKLEQDNEPTNLNTTVVSNISRSVAITSPNCLAVSVNISTDCTLKSSSTDVPDTELLKKVPTENITGKSDEVEEKKTSEDVNCIVAKNTTPTGVGVTNSKDTSSQSSTNQAKNPVSALKNVPQNKNSSNVVKEIKIESSNPNKTSSRASVPVKKTSSNVKNHSVPSVINAQDLQSHKTDSNSLSFNISDSISKTIETIKYAKEERVKKLQLELKLEEARKLVTSLESALKQQNKKLSRMFSKIYDQYKNLVGMKGNYEKINEKKGINSKMKSDIVDINKKYVELASEVKMLRNLSIDKCSPLDQNTCSEIDSNTEKTEDKNKIETNVSISCTNVVANIVDSYVSTSDKNLVSNEQRKKIQNKFNLNEINTQEKYGASSSKTPDTVMSTSHVTNNLQCIQECFKTDDNSIVVPPNSKRSDCLPMHSASDSSEKLSDVTRVPKENVEGPSSSQKLDYKSIVESSLESLSANKNCIDKVNAGSSKETETEVQDLDRITTTEDNITNNIQEDFGGNQLNADSQTITIKSDNEQMVIESEVESKATKHHPIPSKIELLQNCNAGYGVQLPNKAQRPTLKNVRTKIPAEMETDAAEVGHYESPLDFCTDSRMFNPNAIICPFQLMGQCHDQQCKYEHLPDKDGS